MAEKMSIRVILKSGVDFTVKCESFDITRNGLKQVVGVEWKGISENKVLHLDFDQVAAIIRVVSDEVEG